MAVTNTTLRNPAEGGYACNASVVDFAGTFTLLAEADVAVILTDADGVETTLTLTTHYTVAPTGGSYPCDACTVTTVATYSADYTITLIRAMDLTQPTSFGNQGPFYPEINETSYDRNLLLIQQQQEELNRCIRGKASSDTPIDSEDYLGDCEAARAGAETAETNAETAETGAEAALAQLHAVVPINTQSGTTYTLVLADIGKVVRMTNASANTVTIPLNASVAFEIGTTIVIRQSGAGSTTLEGDTGVTLNGISGGSGAMILQYSDVMLQKVDTDTWEVAGNISTVA